MRLRQVRHESPLLQCKAICRERDLGLVVIPFVRADPEPTADGWREVVNRFLERGHSLRRDGGEQRRLELTK